MQKLIAKYGAAAHLALLAAAPLFLFPFCPSGVVATVLLWLSLPALVWTYMAPSVLEGEMLHNARERAFRAMSTDPLLWTCLALVVFTGIRAFNSGIGLSYDAEKSVWFVSDARFAFFPGSVGSDGYLPFSAAVAATVLIQGCRHSLGRSARMAFLLLSSTLSGLTATFVILMAAGGSADALALLQGKTMTCSFAGLAFSLQFLGGVSALVAAFEQKWRMVMPLFAFAIGGTAAGAFVFSPAIISFAGGCAGVVLIVYSFAFVCMRLRGSSEFKFLVFCGISLTLGGLLVAASLPEKTLSELTAPYMSLAIFTDRFWRLRELTGGIALETWLSHIWIGTGIGSFPLDFRFAAKPEAWEVVGGVVASVPNGWLTLLVERGLVGALSMALPVAFLLFSYGWRLVEWVYDRTLPHPACLLTPLALAVVGISGVFDCSVLQADVLLASLAALAVSAKSFLRKRE